MNNDITLSSDKIEKYANQIRMTIEYDNNCEESNIIKRVMDFQPIYGYSDKDSDKIRKKILSTMNVFMDKGLMIKFSEHKSWYLARTRDLQMFYTDRNIKYLESERGFSSRVVESIDNITNDIMDGFGDPSSGNFKRRGLVIGDVQSGKTNTYTTICCKAADVGYKVIILLTGTLENLRRQTQKRLDEGFVGLDSNYLLKKDNVGNKRVGVGLIDPSIDVSTFTSAESDFKTSNMINLGLKIKSTNSPILLVVKKNKNILQNLFRWLKENNTVNGYIDESLLMIDDESDNASINTSSDDVTAINGLIRDILKLFTKTTYVGFTATPYANIFIDPDSVDEMKGDDLFPRHFIYTLSPASNYLGPTEIFGRNSKYRQMIRTIDDAEKYIPSKHKKELLIIRLPPSLEEAINCFILSCVIRDLRGDIKKHMSMLINVSRFTNVQESIKETVQQRLFRIIKNIKAYSKLKLQEAMKNEDLFNLKETWIREYNQTGFLWGDIQEGLEQSSKTIQVRSINQRNGPKNLNYHDNPEGLRLIAIGGNSLSRGLTLEGLNISYFYRRSQTYDTLMQMGRWFGFRDGYSDICRIWMTNESIDWYQYITDATEELKEDIRVMQEANKSPEEFGLLVRNDLSGLYITSRNKMTSAVDRYIVKTVNGRLIETSSVCVDLESVKNNNATMEKLFSDLSKIGILPWFNETTKNNVWRNVPKKYILNLLTIYSNPNQNVIFDTESLRNLIAKDESNLNEWDVAIMHGIGEDYTLGEVNFKCPTRKTYNITSANLDVIQMSRRSLATPLHTKEGLYDDNGDYNNKLADNLMNKYKETHKDTNYSARTFLNTDKRRPILLVYVIDINPGDEDIDIVRKKNIINQLGSLRPIGLGLGFPKVDFTDDSNGDKYIIKYKANVVYDKLGNPDLDEEEVF